MIRRVVRWSSSATLLGIYQLAAAAGIAGEPRTRQGLDSSQSAHK